MSKAYDIDHRLLSDVADLASDGICIVDKNQSIQYMNQSMLDLFGYELEEINTVQIFLTKILPDHKDLNRILSLWKQDSESDNPHPPEREFIVTHKDGHQHWCRFRIARIPSGEMVVTGHDLADEKAVEDALKDSELMSRNIIESIPMGMMMYELEPDNRLIFIGSNPAASTILGVDCSLFTGMTIEEAFPPLAGTEIPDQYRNTAATGEQWHSEQVDYKDNQIAGSFYVHAFQTSPNHMVTTFFDITERKRTEEALARLGAAVDSAAESIIITDPKGIILYVNPYFEEMTGYTKKEVILKHARMLSSGTHDEDFYREMWSTISSGNVWHGRFRNKKKYGTIFEEEAVISPIKNNKGEIVNYVAVKRDVTKEALLQNQVRQSQKMASIGQLAHKITHAFTNTLTMILGNSQIMKDEIGEASTLNQYLDEVIKAANRISYLTGQLLAFSHPAPLKLSPMRADKIFTGIGKILEETIAKHVALTVKIEKNIGKVNVDIAQMEQAMIHLAINADDAMPKGGKLNIEIKATELSKEDIIVLQSSLHEKDRHDGDFAVVTISDNGCGMTDKAKSHIFEPFFTTKKEKQKSGLGLSTVYTIVQQHNGFIMVDSAPDEGTTFRIYLPLINE